MIIAASRAVSPSICGEPSSSSQTTDSPAAIRAAADDSRDSAAVAAQVMAAELIGVRRIVFWMVWFLLLASRDTSYMMLVVLDHLD